MTSRTASRTYGPVQWELFLSALAREVDSAVTSALRDTWLRRVGTLIAGDLMLPPTTTLEAFETEVNEVLADLGWGHARFELDEASRILNIAHERLPAFDDAAGQGPAWLSAVLEGLYTAWLAQLPHAGSASFVARRRWPAQASGSVALVYGRAERVAAPHLGSAATQGPAASEAWSDST